MINDPSSLAILTVATVLWSIGWALDVGTTWRGIQALGDDIRLERNPIARALFRRFPLPVAFGLLLCLESAVIALHWLWAAYLPWSLSSEVAAVFAALSILMGGLGHAFAAHANHTGRLPRILRPIMHIYAWIDRRC
jgi:hypothetical protein